MVKSWKNIYRCEFDSFINENGSFRARVKLLDDHKGLGGASGDFCITSKVQNIDFNSKIIVTQNSIYQF